MDSDKPNIIIYNTKDGKANVSLYAKDGMVWMNQNQLAELFDTSKQNIGQHIANILKEKELTENSVVKKFFTTAVDGKDYNVTFYALDMMLAVGFRVRSKQGTQFRILATQMFVAEQSIHRFWYNNEWWFRVVDVCAELTGSVDAGAYWRKLKQRLKKEGSEVVTNCHVQKLYSK